MKERRDDEMVYIGIYEAKNFMPGIELDGRHYLFRGMGGNN